MRLLLAALTGLVVGHCATSWWFLRNVDLAAILNGLDQ